ncbi:MAG: outer membrane beta-barrel protein [Salegentibacter sp.]
MKLFPTLLLLLVSPLVFSQNFEITGKILDEEGQPLPSATVYVQKVVDSSLVTYTISEKDGSFELSGKSDIKKANLFVSYAGYQPYRKQLYLSEKMNLDPIAMEVQDNTLDEITVIGAGSPVTIKKDTLEFNANSFTTRPGANLEDLMKKLPGVEVDSDGNITINGKPVSRFLVNGEEFFGSDPKIATKNLPKEIIEKVQVTDTKTKSEEFTGKPGDPDNKTVNITIKKDRNKGYFARATAGGGTDDRYELSGIGNYFKDDLRLSVLASSNNINSSGFSYDEVYGMMGRSAGRNVFGGNGGGITKAETAGLNFVNKWHDKLQLNTDYFFGRNNTDRRTVIARENILPDGRYFTNSEDMSNLLNDSHRANARFEVEFDTLTRLSISPRLNANFGKSVRERSAESLDEQGNLINNTQVMDNEDLKDIDFSNDIDFIRRFGGRGAYLQLRLSNDMSRQQNDNFHYSESNFFQNPDQENQIQDQYINEDEDEDRYSVQVSQRSVLADDFFLDLSYDFDYSESTNKRYVYNGQDGSYDQLNDLLSNDFQVISRRHTPSFGLNYEGEIWRINTNFGLLHTSLEDNNFLQDSAFSNTYNDPFLRAEIRYELERSKSLSLRYRTNVDIPSVRQLQPVVDRTNPLNIVVGNPELSPTYRQRINLNYRNFDFSTRTGIFSWFNMDFTDNNVVSVTTVDQDLVRTTTYTNVDGAMGADLGAAYNKQMKDGPKEFRYRAQLRASYDKSIGFTNAVKYTAERYSISPGIRLTYALEDVVEINPNYELTYNSTKYDINPDRNEDFTNHRVGLETTTFWPKNVVFGNDISYNYYGNVSPGFDNSSILWNMSLGYQFLKEKAQLTVKIYDLLDQNVDTRRVIGDDYIQDTQSLILTRYGMLSFTYKLSNFGGAGPPQRGGRYRRH